MIIFGTNFDKGFGWGVPNELFDELFPYSDEYEFTDKKVFRRRKRVTCPKCGSTCCHNGYDYARKKHFGKARIGKQRCLNCGHTIREDKSFWKKLLTNWQETLSDIICALRNSDVAWRAIEFIMDVIVPMGKDKAGYLFNGALRDFHYIKPEGLQIIHYDEQYPKLGRVQKFRLTLLSARTGDVIADELFNDKKAETIKKFLLDHLDPDKPLVAITDCEEKYPAIFKQIWGSRVIHQKCLLHLSKLIVKDFGKFTNIHQERDKYKLLNIFYDRSREINYLNLLIAEQSKLNFETNKERWDWVKQAKRQFYDYLRGLENERRRDRINLPQRTLEGAAKQLATLCDSPYFSKSVLGRLQMIVKNWKCFTAFYGVEGCPATNNAIENYYSASLKTHRKKQLRTDEGIKTHMKLAAMKRREGLPKPRATIRELSLVTRLVVT